MNSPLSLSVGLPESTLPKARLDIVIGSGAFLANAANGFTIQRLFVVASRHSHRVPTGSWTPIWTVIPSTWATAAATSTTSACGSSPSA